LFFNSKLNGRKLGFNTPLMMLCCIKTAKTQRICNDYWQKLSSFVFVSMQAK